MDVPTVSSAAVIHTNGLMSGYMTSYGARASAVKLGTEIRPQSSIALRPSDGIAVTAQTRSRTIPDRRKAGELRLCRSRQDAIARTRERNVLMAAVAVSCAANEDSI